jgi:ParB/RepB/Spo0J family partition protein
MPDLISIENIIPNPSNPRKNFSQESLEELAQSIREYGVIQPLVVRYASIGGDGGLMYRLICGERRLMAAKMAGLQHVPVVFDETAELAPADETMKMLIENLQREDLDPIEEARAYQVVLEQSDYTQETLAGKVGKSQGHIANRMRLLDLPETVRENISRGIISASHGKILAGHKNLPEAILKKATQTIAEEHAPVAKSADVIAKTIAEEGKPLFDDYNSKPEFNIGECEKCEHKAMGNRWGYGDEKPYCLKPGCWEKKQQEARQAREQALADRVQKAAKKGHDVIDLKKFRYDEYVEFRDYKIKDVDISECRDCEHKKVAKSYGDELTETCFMPSCFKKKEIAATREKNRELRDAFKDELEQITDMVVSVGQARSFRMEDEGVIIDKVVLIYIAAQVLASVDPWNDRKITRYQYLKQKFGWEVNSILKSGAWSLLQAEWDAFRQLLETLNERQLLEVIFEWPAVARGLKGAEGWFLSQAPKPEPESRQVDQNPVHALIGKTIRTHYDTGGEVIDARGPRDDGTYTVNYKKKPGDKKICNINSITVKDGVVLCEGIPLTIQDLQAAGGDGRCRSSA